MQNYKQNYKQKSNCTNMNTNIARNRLRRNESVRQTGDQIAWRKTKDYQEVLKKFTYNSIKNDSFKEKVWLTDLDSIDARYKKTLRSLNVPIKNKKYIDTWNVTINTLKNVHKNQCYREKEQWSRDPIYKERVKEKTVKRSKIRSTRHQPNYTPTILKVSGQKTQDKPYLHNGGGGHTIASTTISKAMGTLNILELTAKYYTK